MNTNTIDIEELLQQTADTSNKLYNLWKATGYRSDEMCSAYHKAQDLYNSIAKAILARCREREVEN